MNVSNTELAILVNNNLTHFSQCIYLFISLLYMFLPRSATSRRTPGSITGGVTGNFFRGSPDTTMCPEDDSASESEYQEFRVE